MSSTMNGLQELDYVEALKTYQKTRLDHIRSESSKLTLYLQTLRSNVAKLESRRRKDTNDAIDWIQKISRLRENNLQLRIDCHCLSIEVDLYASGRMALGVMDDNFYNQLRVLQSNRPPVPIIATVSGAAPPVPQRPYPVQQMPRYRHPLHTVRYTYQQVYCPSLGLLSQVPPTPNTTPVHHRLLPRIPAHNMHRQQMPFPSIERPITSAPPLPPRSDRAMMSSPVGRPRIMSAPQSGANRGRDLIDGDDDEGERWVCPKCTVENHSALTYCEVCELPRSVRLVDSTDTVDGVPVRNGTQSCAQCANTCNNSHKNSF
ncbi:unnamed protein product, partial [Oppiella nova]